MSFRPIALVTMGAATLCIGIAAVFQGKASASSASSSSSSSKPAAAKKTPAAKPKPPGGDVISRGPPAPPKPKQLASSTKPDVVNKIPVHAVRVENKPAAPKPAAHTVTAPKPPAPPKPAAPKKRTAREAAEHLYSMATAAIRSDLADQLGSTAHPNEAVRKDQHDMGKIAADGAYGPKTQARGKELLGKPFPTRPHAATPAPKPAPAPKPKTAAAPPKPAASAATTAARELDSYIAAQGGRSRAKIADLQWTLGLDTDGIPGGVTKSRVQDLLLRSVDWPAAAALPANLTGGVPGGSSPKQAADRLVRYYRNNKGRRAERISAYQKMLGVQPVGTVGTQTKAKVEQLNGVKL